MRWAWAVAILCATAGAGRAENSDAAARQSARDHYNKGSVAYDLGHYDQAISEYEAAYEAFNEPTLLYNLGQAHKLARHWPQALHFYKMYLVKVPHASNRAEVESKITALNATIEQENRTSSTPPDHTMKPPETPTPPTTTPTAPAPKEPEVSPATPPSPPPAVPVAGASARSERNPGRTLEIAGLTVGAVGLALVVAGIVTGVLANGASNDISQADAAHQPFDPDKYATYETDLTLTGVLAGIGAAAAITGTALAVVGLGRARHQATAWRVTPALSPTLAGLSAEVRF